MLPVRIVRLKSSSYFLWTALFFLILYLLATIVIGIHMMATTDNDFLWTTYTLYHDGVINPYAPGLATFSSFGAFPQPTLCSRLWNIMLDQSSGISILPITARPLDPQHVPLQGVISGSSTYSGLRPSARPSESPTGLFHPFVIGNDDSETCSPVSENRHEGTR